MEKGGQLYILVAVVIVMVLFGLMAVVNKVSQEDIRSEFEDLSDNYAKESAKLINALIANPDIDIASAFVNFTLMFTSYAKTINPKYGLIYAFYYGDMLYMGNYLDSRLNVGCDTCFRKYAVNGCFETIPATVTFGGLDLSVDIYENVINMCNLTLVRDLDFSGDPHQIDITIKDVPYSFKIKKGHPEIVIVSWEKQAEQRKVFTEGNFIEQEEAAPLTLGEICASAEINTCNMDICSINVNGDCVINCGALLNEEDCMLEQQYCTWFSDRGICSQTVVV
jgi:hypothetical protein